MFLVSPCSCIYAIYRSQVFSREWRYSWRSAARHPIKVRIILGFDGIYDRSALDLVSIYNITPVFPLYSLVTGTVRICSQCKYISTTSILYLYQSHYMITVEVMLTPCQFKNMRRVITYLCYTSNGGLVKTPMSSWHGSIITFHTDRWM